MKDLTFANHKHLQVFQQAQQRTLMSERKHEPRHQPAASPAECTSTSKEKTYFASGSHKGSVQAFQKQDKCDFYVGNTRKPEQSYIDRHSP